MPWRFGSAILFNKHSEIQMFIWISGPTETRFCPSACPRAVLSLFHPKAHSQVAQQENRDGEKGPGFSPLIHTQRWEWKPDAVLLSDETRATPPMAPANLPLLGTLRDTQDPERGTGQLFRAGHMLTLPCLPWVQVSKHLSSFAFSPAPEPTLRTC